jgi:hypothetical protein
MLSRRTFVASGGASLWGGLTRVRSRAAQLIAQFEDPLKNRND